MRSHTRAVVSLSFIINTDWLVSGSRDATVKIWNVESGYCLKTIEHSTYVNAVAVSRTGKHIISATDDGTTTIIIYDKDDEEDYEELFGHIKNATNTS
jgi:platelet-activating factor acetylhydrolase IB subunit alpha